MPERWVPRPKGALSRDLAGTGGSGGRMQVRWIGGVWSGPRTSTVSCQLAASILWNLLFIIIERLIGRKPLIHPA